MESDLTRWRNDLKRWRTGRCRNYSWAKRLLILSNAMLPFDCRHRRSNEASKGHAN